MKKVKIRAMDGALFFFEKLKGKYFMKRRKIQKKIRRSLYIASMLIIIIIIIIITTTFVDKYRGENEREREREMYLVSFSLAPLPSL